MKTSPEMMATFPVLIGLLLCVIWVYAIRYTGRILAEGKLSIRDHKLPIGLSLIAISLCIENVWYGTARQFPELFATMNWMTHVVAMFKYGHIAGFTLILAAGLRAIYDRPVLGECVAWVVAAYLASWAFFVVL